MKNPGIDSNESQAKHFSQKKTFRRQSWGGGGGVRGGGGEGGNMKVRESPRPGLMYLQFKASTNRL